MVCLPCGRGRSGTFIAAIKEKGLAGGLDMPITDPIKEALRELEKEFERLLRAFIKPIRTPRS